MISRVILLDHILNIYNIHFDNKVSQIHNSELLRNKASTSYTVFRLAFIHF